MYLWNGTEWKRADTIFDDVIKQKISFDNSGDIISETAYINGVSSQKSFHVAPFFDEENSHQNFIFSVNGVSALGISNGNTGIYAHREQGRDYMTLMSEDFIELKSKEKIKIKKITQTDTISVVINDDYLALKNGKSVITLQKNGLFFEYNGQTIVIDDNGINIGNGAYTVANPNPPTEPQPTNNGGNPGAGFQ